MVGVSTLNEEHFPAGQVACCAHHSMSCAVACCLSPVAYRRCTGILKVPPSGGDTFEGHCTVSFVLCIKTPWQGLTDSRHTNRDNNNAIVTNRFCLFASPSFVRRQWTDCISSLSAATTAKNNNSIPRVLLIMEIWLRILRLLLELLTIKVSCVSFCYL